MILEGISPDKNWPLDVIVSTHTHQLCQASWLFSMSPPPSSSSSTSGELRAWRAMAWSIAFSLAVLVVGGCCTTQVKLCSNLVNLGDDGDCSQRTVQARCTKSPVSFQNSMKHAKCPVVSNYTATCGQCVPMAASCVLDCALKGCPRVHVIGVTNVDECSLSNVDILAHSLSALASVPKVAMVTILGVKMTKKESTWPWSHWLPPDGDIESN